MTECSVADFIVSTYKAGRCLLSEKGERIAILAVSEDKRQ